MAKRSRIKPPSNAEQHRPSFAISLPGNVKRYCFGDYIPPVGATIDVHKHLTANGANSQVVVVAHKWVLDDKNGDPDDSSDLPLLNLSVETIEKKLVSSRQKAK